MASMSTCRRTKPKVEKKKTPEEKVRDIPDLMTEIITRVPGQSMIKMKRVNREFRALISSMAFACDYAKKIAEKKKPDDASFFLYKHNHTRPESRYLALSDRVGKPRARVPGDFPKDRISILQACEGLFLCCSDYSVWFPRTNLYVCNATTKQSRAIPHPGFKQGKSFIGIGFAFAPFQSAEYKIVGLWKSLSRAESGYSAEIYSSETRAWRASDGENLVQRFGMPMFSMNAVFLKGTLYWLERDYHGPKFGGEIEFGISFDINTECLKPFPLPPRQNGGEYGTSDNKVRFSYFGACDGHLVLIEKMKTVCLNNHEFLVYEMRDDHSEWDVTYHFNIHEFIGSSAQPIRASILSVVKGDEDDGLLIVICLGAKIISYGVKTEKKKILQQFRRCSDPLMFDWCHTFQYTESIYPV